MKTLIISLLVTLLLLTASPLAQGQDARLYDKDQIGSHTGVLSGPTGFPLDGHRKRALPV